MKLKTHSATKKRVKKTGTGKYKFRKSATQHLLTSKSKRQKKLHRSGKVASPSDTRALARLLPYG